MKLSRKFSPLSLLMITVNGTVGSAWLFAPLYASRIAGSGALIAWLIAGFATALVALTFAELSVLFPVAGGSAEIPKITHGCFTSFVVSFTAWLSALTMAPIEVQAILQYASTYFKTLTHLQNGVPTLTFLGLGWATALMLLFCIINLTSFKKFERFNTVIFIFKIGVILLTIFAFVKVSFHSLNFKGGFDVLFNAQGWHSILVAVATAGVAFAFTGFKHGVELAGEAKNSRLAIPLAIFGSVIFCLILYLGLQIAFIGALSPSHLAKGWSQLNFMGDVGPFAGLAIGLSLLWLVKLLYLDAAISPLGAGLVYVTSTARILYAMSRIGTMPRWMSYLNKQQLPLGAVFFNFVLGMFLFLPLPGWEAMVSFLVSGMVISYAMGPIALLCLRFELPHRPRSFHLPAAPILCYLAFYFCNLLSYWTGWETIFKFAIAVLIGIVFFIFAYLRGRLKNQSLGLKAIRWIFPYFLGLVVISYCGSFGGKKIIPFGWDFLVIALFSFVILWLAVKNRVPLCENENLREAGFSDGFSPLKGIL